MGLCFCFLSRFLLSSRRTAGGVPSASRAADFTALVLLNLRVFFFFGKLQLTTEATEVHRGKMENAKTLSLEGNSLCSSAPSVVMMVLHG